MYSTASVGLECRWTAAVAAAAAATRPRGYGGGGDGGGGGLTMRDAGNVCEKRKLVVHNFAAQIARERVLKTVETHVHRVHNILFEYDVAMMAHVRRRVIVLFG